MGFIRLDRPQFALNALALALIFAPLQPVPQKVDSDADVHAPGRFGGVALHGRERHAALPLFCFHSRSLRAFSRSI